MDKYVIALLKCKGIGNVKLLNFILKYNRNISNILTHLNEIITAEDIYLFENYLREAEQEINQNKSMNINVISILNMNYPNKLLMIKDPVLYLYYKGDISLIYNTSVAIIGSRNINNADELLTRDIAKKFSIQGITVVSGLALGTDVNAHIGSYNEKGKTIAILASGLNNITPSCNKKIAYDILKSGGLLLSEYSAATPPTKYTFVKRDRIQAALSDAVIVINADEKSGTMNAVKTAQNCNKYVTQYIKNKNKLIISTFDNTVEDISMIINKAKQQDYKIINNCSYEQETLF